MCVGEAEKVAGERGREAAGVVVGVTVVKLCCEAVGQNESLVVCTA